MTRGTNDNKLSFITFKAATENVTRYLKSGEEQQKQSDHERERRGTDDENAKRNRGYVDYRLKELAAFERKAKGIK